MAGVPEPRPDPRRGLEPALVGHALHLAEAGLGVGAGIDRLDRRAAALLVAPVEALDLALLDVAAVGQHEGGEIDGRRRGVDRPREPVLAELRHEPAVVDVGVGQEEEVDARRLERERPVVELADALRTLEHAAVDQEAPAPVLDQVARAGHRAGAAMEDQLHGGSSARGSAQIGSSR